MELLITFSSILIIILFIIKWMTHFKLLKLKDDHTLDEKIDPGFLFFTDSNILLKAKSSTLLLIEERYENSYLNNLKNKINKLIIIVRWAIISELVLIVIRLIQVRVI